MYILQWQEMQLQPLDSAHSSSQVQIPQNASYGGASNNGFLTQMCQPSWLLSTFSYTQDIVNLHIQHLSCIGNKCSAKVSILITTGRSDYNILNKKELQLVIWYFITTLNNYEWIYSKIGQISDALVSVKI